MPTDLSQGTRRLAAIMFTDMVGYTALGQKNEELSLALVKEQRSLIRPILSRHNGREVKTIGDAFLVEFPNAVDAIRCAYDIQRVIREFNLSFAYERRIHLRVGVHVGEVVESQGDISGDAVNVASRIEPLAEDGGVCFTRQVYDHIKNKLDFHLSSLGPKTLRNMTEPVEVYKLVLPWDETAVPSQALLDKKRIAVLPFVSLSPDPDDEYFADGLTEELIDRLCQVRELEVIARTSVMSYKKKEKKVAEIAKELSAGSLVEGSVRKAGSKIRVTAQLVDGATEGHLWSSRYDKSLDDIFAVQTDIATQVTDVLRISLLKKEKSALERRASRSTEAYTLYLKGRYYWNERTKESLEKAVLYFKKALEEDPDLALAYTGLADSYSVMLDRGYARNIDVLDLARTDARRALEIDGSLAEAHLALGGIFQHTFDWSSAEHEFKKALELNPNLSQAYHWLGVNYEVLNHWDKAVEAYSRAMELDPLSKHLMGVAAYGFVMAGRVEEGAKLAQEAVDRFPDAPWGHTSLSLACLKNSQDERAVEEARKAFRTSPGGGHPWEAAFFLYVLNKTGRLEEAEETSKRYLSIHGAEPWNPTQLAMVYLSMGDTNKAFELLERAYAESDPALIYIGWPPIFDSVRSDPRYLKILRKVKPV